MSDEIDPGLGLDSIGGLAAFSRAASFFMSVKGQKSGDIKGGSKMKGHTDKIELLGCEQTLVSPRDAATGLPTGRRMHHALQVAGKLDKSGPLLWQALCTNENLTTVKIEYWSAISKQSGIAAGSAHANVYNFEMTNAQISEFQHFTAMDGSLFFVCAFTFQKITVTWVDGGMTGTDEWLSLAT